MTARTCQHPTCERVVPPTMLACRLHWFQLPPALRALIWRHYRPGQEADRSPSPEYVDALLACIAVWQEEK